MDSITSILLQLLVLPIVPVSLLLGKVLGDETIYAIVEQANKASMPIKLVLREFISPTIPFLLVGMIYYIHKFGPELVQRTWPIRILYLVTLWEVIVRFWTNYIIDPRSSGAIIRVDIFLLGLILWARISTYCSIPLTTPLVKM